MDLQVKGGHHDSVEHIILNSDEEATVFFEKVKFVFLNVNCWGKLFDQATEFQLCHKDGKDKYDVATIGDLVKIKIPGPKSFIGEGDDYIQITELKIEENVKFTKCMMVFSPCPKPGVDVTTHFFESDAKNYFIIKKFRNEISAEVHGRNEVPNYDNLPLADIARNFIVAYIGILGFSKAQWATWVKNILDEKSVDSCIKQGNKVK